MLETKDDKKLNGTVACVGVLKDKPTGSTVGLIGS